MRLLKAKRVGPRRCYAINRFAVEELKQNPPDIISRTPFGRLRIRVNAVIQQIESIERRLDLLMEASGLNVSGLRDATDEELIALHKEAKEFKAIDHKKITLDHIQTWCPIFAQLTTLEFDRLLNLVPEVRPWMPFYDLCIRFMRHTRRRNAFRTSWHSQEAYRLLERGRKNLETAIIVVTEMVAYRTGSAAAQRLDAVAPARDNLLRMVRALER